MKSGNTDVPSKKEERKPIVVPKLRTRDVRQSWVLGFFFFFSNWITETKYVNAGGSSHTRGLVGGGQDKTSIDVITIASLGNAVGFGDISTANDGLAAANDIQRVAWGGGSVPARENTIEFVNINSAGNAIDFGDLTAARDNPQGNCGSHGGIRSY